MTRIFMAATIGLIPLLFACKAEDPEDTNDPVVEIDEMEEMTAYMAENDLDLPNMLDAWIKNPQDVFDAGVENFFIVDIRTADMYTPELNDFEEGHIAGAHNVPLADVVDYVQTNNTEDLPVLVVCYTGNTAGHAAMALRLSGDEAYVLKWGMSGWHSDFDLWTPNLKSQINDYTGAWDTEASMVMGTYDLPVLETGFETGEEILEARIDAALAEFHKIPAADVLSSPDDYFVVNYWAQTDWDHYGHIAGAAIVPPGDLTLDTLDMLDPDADLVVYCWTGQTSSMVTAWLNVMGYPANSLLFGTNTMIYDTLESHKFPGALDLNYVKDL